VGKALGRGTWARSWLVRDESGREVVARVTLGAADLGEDSRDAIEACRRIAQEQEKLLREPEATWLPRLDGTLVAPDGSPVLLLPRYSASLEQKLDDGTRLAEIVRLLNRVAEVLDHASVKGMGHGNLRPSNIFLDARGDPVLADPLTPTAASGPAAWRR